MVQYSILFCLLDGAMFNIILSTGWCTIQYYSVYWMVQCLTLSFNIFSLINKDNKLFVCQIKDSKRDTPRVREFVTSIHLKRRESLLPKFNLKEERVYSFRRFRYREGREFSPLIFLKKEESLLLAFKVVLHQTGGTPACKVV